MLARKMLAEEGSLVRRLQGQGLTLNRLTLLFYLQTKE
jgi:hypothetical protein